jgi:rubredoxin
MAVYVCGVCEHAYDEQKEGSKWSELTSEWVCPVCESEKDLFTLQSSTDDVESAGVEPSASGSPSTASANSDVSCPRASTPNRHVRGALFEVLQSDSVSTRARR